MTFYDSPYGLGGLPVSGDIALNPEQAQASGMSYQDYATSVAQTYGIPSRLFLWQLNQESSWNPNAVNGLATGIAQFMPQTAKQYGVTDTFNPYDSILGAGQYMSDLFKQTGSWAAALEKYGTIGSSSPENVLQGAQAAISASDNISSYSTNTQQTSQTSGPFSIFDRIPGFIVILLGVVLLGGAIYLYGNESFASAFASLKGKV